MKILLVEDDEPTGSALSEALTAHHYLVNLATDGKTGLDLAETFDYDLILLDVLVPQLDGITVCRQLRSRGYQKPILLLTAKDSNSDRVTGLDAGADDYVVKPYDLAELLARIRALLRRGSESLSATLQWGNLRLDTTAGEVLCNGTLILLTPKEYSLLELFLRHPHRIFNRSEIIDRLWSFDNAPAETAVTTHIKDLRQKLKQGGVCGDLIETVYGFGYRLKADPEAGSVETATNGHNRKREKLAVRETVPIAPKPIAPEPPPNLTRINALVERFRGTFMAQVAVLEQAIVALQQDGLEAELHQQAKQEAHKLAGSLGIFGYQAGSMLARQAEQLLGAASPLEPATAKPLAQWVSAIRQELAQPPRPAAAPSPPAAPPVALLPPPIVLLVDDDVALTERLRSEAVTWGIHLKIATNIAAARQAIATAPPDVVLLDLNFPNSGEDGLSFLAELAVQQPGLPVVVLTERNELADRVEVSRLGGRGYLLKPVPLEQILTAIAQVLPQNQTKTGRVLIVDDDPSILAALETLLRSWGLQVVPLNDPQQFWQVLTTSRPDLLLLDLEMPRFSGVDLCRVVRQDAHWGHLPVLVVTAHTDGESIQQVFGAGADDFIVKPVVEPELVTRIISRIERVRLRRKENYSVSQP